MEILSDWLVSCKNQHQRTWQKSFNVPEVIIAIKHQNLNW
jgi:hypothetical protein